MLNETTTSRLLEITNGRFDLVKSQYFDCEFSSSEDLRNYRVKLIADKSSKQLADLKMKFQIQQQTQEIEELKLINLQYQAAIETATSKESEFKNHNQHPIDKSERVKRVKKNLKRLLDLNENIDINSKNVKRTEGPRDITKTCYSNENNKDEMIDELRNHNATLLREKDELRNHNATLLGEKDELLKEGGRFKVAHDDFKRSYEDLKTKYEEVCAEKKTELVRDPRITKLISDEKDAKIQELSKLNAELQEQLRKQTERSFSPNLKMIKKERDAELFELVSPRSQQVSVGVSNEADSKIRLLEVKMKKHEEFKTILEDSLRKKDTNLAQNKKEIKRLITELEKYESKFSLLNSSYDKLRIEAQIDKIQISDLKKQYISSKERYEKELKRMTERLGKEQQCINNLKQELTNQKSKLENQNKQIVKLKMDHEKQIIVLQSELDKEQLKAGELSKINEELSRSKYELKSKQIELEKYRVLYEKVNDYVRREQVLINELTRVNNDCQKKFTMGVEFVNLLKEKLAITEQLLTSNRLLVSLPSGYTHSPPPSLQQQQQQLANGFVPIDNQPLTQWPLSNSVNLNNQQSLAEQQQNKQSINLINSQSPTFDRKHQRQANGVQAQLSPDLNLQMPNPNNYLSQSPSRPNPDKMTMNNVRNLSTPAELVNEAPEAVENLPVKLIINKEQQSPPPSNDDADI